jgi:hypothetical protein
LRTFVEDGEIVVCVRRPDKLEDEMCILTGTCDKRMMLFALPE